MLVFPQMVLAFGGGSGTCVIDQNFNSITGMDSGMFNRRRNFEAGPYTVTSNFSHYSPNTPVELTIAGPEYAGILFTVVDEMGNNVGNFDLNTNIVHACQGSMAIVTHSGTSDFGNMTSYTLFWMPPSTNVGRVYVLGYVLKGARGDLPSQEFYRFVRDDNSAISINANDVFSNGFE